jgi:hypothetical protein
MVMGIGAVLGLAVIVWSNDKSLCHRGLGGGTGHMKTDWSSMVKRGSLVYRPFCAYSVAFYTP